MRSVKQKICVIVCCLVIAICFCGCTSQEIAKSFGGDMTVDLEPGEKLEMITWKDNSLWYLTRPMRDDETAETHTFKQSSSWGVFEGTVTVIEHEE